MALRWLLGALLCWSLRTGVSRERPAEPKYHPSFGYVQVDPTEYDPAYVSQKNFDADRSLKECFCGESRHRSIWLSFYVDLQRNLAEDPSFTGDWVHRLCGTSYPVIFRVVSVDPQDDSFTFRSDCPAGLLAMASVCAQSAALQRLQAEPAEEPTHFDTIQMEHLMAGSLAEGDKPEDFAELWAFTERVVRKEGESVGDFFGPVSLKECISHCNRVPRCMSISHGPHGCHLKDRCVSPGEDMVPAGEQGADYRTVFRKSCSSLPGKKPDEMHNSHTQELQNMMGFALRALEFCLHCLDASPWPFLLKEVLENYALAVEGPDEFLWHRAAGRMLGTSTQPGPVPKGEEPPNLDPPKGVETLGALPAVRRMLLTMQVRWTRGLEMEASFWRDKLSLDPEENVSLERLKQWLATGAVPWTLPGDDLCGYVADGRKRRGNSYTGGKIPRVLNAGSGPLAPKPLDCQLDGRPSVVKVVAADGLARFYNRVLDERELKPPYLPLQCPVEELHECFPSPHFDVVHIRNALDHSFDPVLGIRRMLQVTRPGGWVLLRHARNEGVPGQFRNGLHQWAFDVDSDEASEPHFIIWNPDLRVDVTEFLLATGCAAEVKIRLVDHPSDDAPEDERYVWVDVRKPTVTELAKHFRIEDEI